MHEISQKLYKALVLVCENRRDDGRKSCGVTQVGLRLAIKEAMKAAGLPVRVVSTSCLDHCNEGPTIAFMPMNVKYGDVSVDDIPEIVQTMKHYLEEYE
jgi:(2Fe-2S) ferredoxin